MAGAAGNDDDLSTLMPKSVQGLNASESTENESQALREYLDLQVRVIAVFINNIYLWMV